MDINLPSLMAWRNARIREDNALRDYSDCDYRFGTEDFQRAAYDVASLLFNQTHRSDRSIN